MSSFEGTKTHEPDLFAFRKVGGRSWGRPAPLRIANEGPRDEAFEIRRLGIQPRHSRRVDVDPGSRTTAKG
ncbi:hypothetical protein AKJ09_07640 [Labilithrix luteola]|uniref:Uncharacterized protein n=1 Tax=Labilithrix luteola TaxID=1391654 RepID=A0A0K1Q5P1_9BACT|nr:hypothetical protein AKJ09_07640 [Labilithrix luteola]